MRYLFFLLSTILVLAGCEQELVISPAGSSKPLPVFSLQMDEKYLWSDDSGLFVVGTNGAEDWTGTVANYLQDWEFPCLVTYVIENDTIFREQVGFRIKGKSGRHEPNKSIGLYWRDEYGSKNIKARFFKDQVGEKFKRLTLRNGSNDPDNLIFKDAILGRLVAGYTKLEIAQGQPVVVYINGKYWGLYDLREMITPHHFKYRYGVDDEKVNILEEGPVSPKVDDGIPAAWNTEVIAYMQKNDMVLDEHYSYISSKIDIESLIDYYVIETYIFNWDWPVNNMKWWNEPTSKDFQQWRYILHDADYAFYKPWVHNLWLGSFYKLGNEFREEFEPGFFVFDKLMQNMAFRRAFMKRYLFFVDEVFAPARVNSFVDDIVAETRKEYEKHHERWPETTSVPQGWLMHWQRVKDFNSERNKWIRPKLVSWIEELEN